MRRLIRRLTPFAALIVVLFAAFPPEVRAHGYLVRAIPDNRAVLERAPVRVQYWFSESLEPAFSSITIRDAAGGEIAAGGVDARDPRLLTTRLPIGLPDGVYSVDLRLAFASDGHVIAERRAFFVGASGAFAGIEAQTSAVPLEIAWRALVLIGTTLLFGIYGTYALVFIPAWGNTAHPAGNLPPRVMRRVHRIAGLALGMALVGNLIALMQQSMVYFDADIGRVLSENLWSVVRTSTRFGDTWNARMALLALIAALHAAALSVRASQPPLVRAFLTANLWALPPLILTWSVSAHAAGSPILPWAALISDWLHGVGVGLWAGGVAALALILPVALQPYVADERAAIMRAALRRFSPLALACVAVVIATGIYNATNWIAHPADVALPYGVALLLKLALIAPLLALGYVNKPNRDLLPPPSLQVERGRLSVLDSPSARGTSPVRSGGGGGRLQVNGNRGVSLEAIAAAAVLIAAATLSATPVPPLEIAGRDQPPPSAVARVDDMEMSVTVAPGGPGVNTVDVALTRGGVPVEAAAVRARLTQPTRDVRRAWQDAEPIGGGVYTAAGDEIDRAGAWWLIVQIDAVQRAFAFDIRADAAVALTRDPSPINVIALVGVLCALGWAALPSLRRFARWLDWSPGAVAVAGGAIAAAVGVVIVGIIASNTAAAQLDAQLNPPPAVVNIRLPDAESLGRGEIALDSACGWTGGTLAELVRRLERTRDDALYAAVRDGWRDLSACSTNDETTRWDIVNWIRWGLG